MGKRIDAIKRQEQMSPNEILAGLIWDRAVNSKDHIFKVPYYRFPCYIEYSHEYQEDSFTVDCLYLGQEHNFMLIQPNYKEILAIAPQILEWLEATYVMCCPPAPPRPKSGRRNRVANRQQIANSVINLSAQNTPQRAQQRVPSNQSKEGH